MRRYLSTWLWALALAGACAGNQHSEALLEKGTPAPDFQAADKDGSSLKLAELRRNGPVVLTFLRSLS